MLLLLGLLVQPGTVLNKRLVWAEQSLYTACISKAKLLIKSTRVSYFLLASYAIKSK